MTKLRENIFSEDLEPLVENLDRALASRGRSLPEAAIKDVLALVFGYHNYRSIKTAAANNDKKRGITPPVEERDIKLTVGPLYTEETGANNE